MSSNRIEELVAELKEAQTHVDEIKAKLGQELGYTTPTVSTPTKAPKVSSGRRGRPKGSTNKRKTAATVVSANGDGAAAADDNNRQPSLKEVVQDILQKNGKGMELKEIVAEVTRMIKNGQYHSKAKKGYTQIVSQAVFSLKQENLVAVEKSPTNNRNVYSLAAAA